MLLDEQGRRDDGERPYNDYQPQPQRQHGRGKRGKREEERHRAVYARRTVEKAVIRAVHRADDETGQPILRRHGAFKRRRVDEINDVAQKLVDAVREHIFETKLRRGDVEQQRHAEKQRKPGAVNVDPSGTERNALVKSAAHGVRLALEILRAKIGGQMKNHHPCPKQEKNAPANENHLITEGFAITEL